jgi:acyl carrier protein
MSPEKLRDAVLAAVHRIAPEADLSSLADDVDLREELDLDSMDVLHVVTALHDALGVEIPERDYGKLTTIGGAVQYLSAALRDTASP